MKRFDPTRDEAALRGLLGEDAEFCLEGWLRFGDIASTWAARTDLFSAPRPAAAIDVLFLDALNVWRAGMIHEGSHVVDIGAGVGAPALPLALAMPTTRWTLVEPRRRRVVFLRTAVGALGLRDRVTVHEGRLVPGSTELGRFDVAISRATFALGEWIRLGRDLAPVTLGFVGENGVPEGAEIPEPVAEAHYTTLDRKVARGALRFETGLD